LEHLADMEPTAFWLELKQITDCNAKPKFDVLSQLMYTVVAIVLINVDQCLFNLPLVLFFQRFFIKKYVEQSV